MKILYIITILHSIGIIYTLLERNYIDMFAVFSLSVMVVSSILFVFNKNKATFLSKKDVRKALEEMDKNL